MAFGNDRSHQRSHLRGIPDEQAFASPRCPLRCSASLVAGSNVAIAAQKTAATDKSTSASPTMATAASCPCSAGYQRSAGRRKNLRLLHRRRLRPQASPAPSASSALNRTCLRGPPPPRRRTAAPEIPAARPNAPPRWAEIHSCSAEPLQSSLRRFQCRIRDTLGEMRPRRGRGCATQLREDQAPPPKTPPTTGRAKRHRPHRTTEGTFATGRPSSPARATVSP